MYLQVRLFAHQPGDGDYSVCQGCKGSGLARNGKPAPATQQFGLDLVPGEIWDLNLMGGFYVTTLQIAGTD